MSGATGNKNHNCENLVFTNDSFCWTWVEQKCMGNQEQILFNVPLKAFRISKFSDILTYVC